MSNETILAIAVEAGKRGGLDPRDLRRARGIGGGTDVEALARVAADALAGPPPQLPQRARGEARDRGAEHRAERLRVARVEWAKGLGLEPALVLPPALIDALARDPPASEDRILAVPGMTRWRAEVLGPELWKISRSG